MGDTLRIGVLGAGYLGSRHARHLAASPGWDLVCVHDIAAEKADTLARELNCTAASTLDDALEGVEAVVVATSTLAHRQVTERALAAGCHALVEKPITGKVAEAEALAQAAKQAGLVLHVGHVERFNPAIAGLVGRVPRPLFVESHRLAPLVPRSLDINVLQDLMIHDIDLALMFIGSEPESVMASGVPVLSSKVDIANARLTFPGGITANLTASRVSLERTRKFRMFFPGNYVSVDCAARKSELYQLRSDREDALREMLDSANPLDMLRFLRHTTIEDRGVDALDEEHRAFRTAIEGRSHRGVTAWEALKTLRVLVRVEEAMSEHLADR